MAKVFIRAENDHITYACTSFYDGVPEHFVYYQEGNDSFIDEMITPWGGVKVNVSSGMLEFMVIFEKITTVESPSFSSISILLSRLVLFILKPLM